MKKAWFVPVAIGVVAALPAPSIAAQKPPQGEIREETHAHAGPERSDVTRPRPEKARPLPKANLRAIEVEQEPSARVTASGRVALRRW